MLGLIHWIKMNELKILIKNKDWQNIAELYTPEFLAKNLSFIDGMVLSRKLLENDEWDDNIQTTAINLINAIRKWHQVEWESDWRHDAYLGYAYDLRGWDYEEQFDTYKRAANKCLIPDSEILMRLALNWSCPGVYKSKIDEKTAIELLETAMQETPYIEGVSCLLDLYDRIGDNKKKEYWEKVQNQSENNNLRAPYAFMEFFKEYGWEVS